MQLFCEVCGNEVDSGSSHCPFCESELKFSLPGQGVPHQAVKLKRGMPTVEQALGRLDRELEQAKKEGCRVLTLIHGYGSSGQGGAIREEIRAKLQYLKYRGEINDVFTGEQFSTGNGPGRNLLRRFPFLRQHRDLNRGNRGITLVVL
ncbi:MAG: Smr/MutS family protein [Candidatus Electrothrix sp. GW3-4]|uniref:Smr/MutS family protein n=1 Tax=Candidatus Electrothrix sp. GW3-4 TaxID=3126740 RepID=UPI0030CB0C95